MKTTTEEFLTLSKALAIANVLLENAKKSENGLQAHGGLADEWKNAIEKANKLIVTQEL
jgi:hypothetical protein